MHTIVVSTTDLTRIKVILSALKKGKWELEGEEILAFAQGFNWVAEMHERVKSSLEAKSEIKPEPTKNEVKKVKR